MENSKGKRKKTTPGPLAFETAMEQLEAAVRELEKGDLPLETALQIFAQGMEMSALCVGKLQAAEQQIDRIIEEKNGQPQQLPWKTGEDDE